MIAHLQECFAEWLQIHDFDYDYSFYTPDEWRARGEEYLVDSELVFAGDNQLIALMSVGSDLEDELQDLAEGFGYYFEFGQHWNFAFYRREGLPALPDHRIDYRELLRDPRWIKKRERVAERSGSRCEDCGVGGQTLHVAPLLLPLWAAAVAVSKPIAVAPMPRMPSAARQSGNQVSGISPAAAVGGITAPSLRPRQGTLLVSTQGIF